MTGRFLFLAAGVFASVALSAADAAAHRAAEQLRYFSASAARRGLADLKANPKYDYAKWAPKVEALIAAEGDVRAVLKAEAAPGLVPPAPTGRKLTADEAVALVEGYRAAMLANPILDFDRILCVRRKIKNPRSLQRETLQNFSTLLYIRQPERLLRREAKPVPWHPRRRAVCCSRP